ncbi:MAG: NAD-binding protein, partial [Gammaproteobacteria bacterium]|nr:NAD-binding protein [Gammaproteobacteria bacterium]
MGRAVVLVIIIMTLFVLGHVGLARVGADGSWVDRTYSIVQLFGMEGDWTKDMAVVPVEIEIVRFLAPLMVIATLVTVFFHDARVAFSNAQIRFFSSHVVVVGVNDLSWHLIRSHAGSGRRIVALEQDPDNRLIEECRRRGVRVVVGDWLNPRNLIRAGVDNAAHVIALAESDSINVELMLLTKSLRAELGDTLPLTFHIHLRDTQLAQEFEEFPKFFDDYGRVQVNFFNVDEISARSLFLQYPFELYADALRLTRVHIAVLGYNDPAEEVIVKAASTAHYATMERPRLTIFADDAHAFASRLLSRHEGLLDAAELDFRELSEGNKLYFELDDTPVLKSVTAYIVCMPDDQACLKLALGLHRALMLRKGENAPIFVRMQSSQGLAQLLEGGDPDAEVPDGIWPFGMLDRLLDVENVVDNTLDTLARAEHANYVAESKTVYETGRGSTQPWNTVAERYRNDSRATADHLEVKLRAIGCSRVARPMLETFEPDEIHKLARMEKHRYRADRYIKGWRPGPRRNSLAKIDNSAFDDDLSWDLKSVGRIPEVLNIHLDEGIARDTIIGVTGHRLDKLDLSTPHFKVACVATLREIERLHPNSRFWVVSALAEGADRYVAELAMDVLGAA